ncbi:kinesin-like protein KIN-12G [Elaeis guineensis]|uniref:Kinesin-like protein KIN-12G n=1 Tax=Elaeis guineensis var. tenera TaxID=51953 RepID=A0A6I9R189_ELAGV|nr:kinesin-like protein KIN-12G [Elaeis guineensis]
MPAVAEPGSAFRSRVRFQDPGADSEAADGGGNDANGERAVVSGGFPVQSFELQEDLSFWKDHNVQVVIRIRPLSSSEISLQGHNRCVRQESCQTITWIGHPESRFTFDHVADEYVSQEKLFKVAGVPMVENCVAGYNSCMFAYGQTGSGKTHTMLGDIEGGTRRHSINCGMTPRVFEHLFSRIQKEKESRRDEKLRFTCKCSFLEIYNEQILDLLNPSSVNLQIREDAKKGVHVENLTEFEVSSARDVMQQLIQGAANRKVAATNMNRASSRSHSVFTCVIESKWESQGVTHHRYARLNLVDLAGSERQKSSGAEGDRLKEATNINKSLSTLGLVIMNLVSISNGKSLHVPYRDSKLTFLLQDSLGGNSKTIIIANISPSNCCALETLSTLKFAQRAKFIRNNAIINEDASGDVLSMRLQIQQLKKEVNRLRVLVNCGAENPESDGLSASVAGSPGSFKWDAGLGSFSPLTFDKRISQRKEYEAALIAAFRRDQDKEAALKAMAAGKLAAEQLATQRTEEVRSLKMRLRFREEGIKRLEAVASGKLSAETHLLQEKEELLKEIDILRNQVDRNPEVTRFAMENLQLKEELRRLQSFAEEGEREMMNEQITVLQEKLMEALDWKLMHEKDPDVAQDLSLSWESSTNEENEFLRLQAIQNQKETEALRKNLSFCLEAKEKLERHVEELVSQLEEERKSARHPNRDIQDAQIKDFTVSGANDLSHDQVELKTMVDAIAAASQREAESHETAIMLAKDNEQLRMKLKVLIEDNNRLIELYEGAVAEGSANQAGNAPKMKNSENQVNCLADFSEDGHDNLSDDNYDPGPKDVEHLEHQLLEMHEENEKLMGLYERAMHERDEFKRMLSSYESNKSEHKEETKCPEKLAEVDEERVYENQDKVKLEEHAMHAEVSEEKLHLVRGKLELVEDKLATTGQAVQFFGLLEDASTEVDELLENIGVTDLDVQLKQREITALKHALSQIHERKTGVDNKFLALKFASNSFCSNVQYWEEREAQARARVDACSSHLEQKHEELRLLKVHKDEISTACIKARHSESELRSNIDCLKLKLQDAETRRKETEKVLFAIDNLDRSDLSTHRGLNFGKASELLKSEEERTQLSAEMKQLREQLAAVQKEIAKWMKKSEALDMKIQNLEKEIRSGLLSLQESEHGLQQAVRDKEMLLEMREDARIELGILLVEYQECIFELDLKEGEIKLFEEAAQREVSSLEGLRAKLVVATQKLNQLLEDNRRITLSNSEECSQYVSIAQKVERELEHVQLSVTEAKSMLLSSNS